MVALEKCSLKIIGMFNFSQFLAICLLMVVKLHELEDFYKLDNTCTVAFIPISMHCSGSLKVFPIDGVNV